MAIEHKPYRDPDALLRELEGRLDPEALRAFAVACCRQVWGSLDERCREAVSLAGRFTAGRASFADLDAARERFRRLGEAPAATAAWYTVWRDPLIAAREGSWYAAAAAVGRDATKSSWEAERAAQAGLLLRMVSPVADAV